MNYEVTWGIYRSVSQGSLSFCGGWFFIHGGWLSNLNERGGSLERWFVFLKHQFWKRKWSSRRIQLVYVEHDGSLHIVGGYGLFLKCINFGEKKQIHVRNKYGTWWEFSDGGWLSKEIDIVGV